MGCGCGCFTLWGRVGDFDVGVSNVHVLEILELHLLRAVDGFRNGTVHEGLHALLDGQVSLRTQRLHLHEIVRQRRGIVLQAPEQQIRVIHHRLRLARAVCHQHVPRKAHLPDTLAARIARPGRSRAVHGGDFRGLRPRPAGQLPASAARMARHEAPRGRRRP